MMAYARDDGLLLHEDCFASHDVRAVMDSSH
jgi:hypothetical protein